MSGKWRPISEAPKDGAAFVGYDGQQTAICEWYDWSLIGGEGYKWFPLPNPTHWLELPLRPTLPPPPEESA